ETRKLYLQTIAPLLFREQTRGWTGILAAVPRHYQIRDPGRRAVEFLLSLDAYERARRREELRVEEASIAAEWRGEVTTFPPAVDVLGGRREGIASQASVDWAPAVRPAIWVLDDERWVSLQTMLGNNRAELETLENEEIPRAADVVDRATAQLTEAENTLAR